MEQKVNRVIRACVELGAGNPIVSIHDQGAGGNCNVLKEIVSPAGKNGAHCYFIPMSYLPTCLLAPAASSPSTMPRPITSRIAGGVINVRSILCGDASLSVLEIWGAEYQEADALLLRPEAAPLFTALCARERAPVAYVGTVTGDGRIVLRDGVAAPGARDPVDMDLEKVLGNMPQKTYNLARVQPPASGSVPFSPPATATLREMLDRVLRVLAVGSKRFLTNKVDRAVSGLVARQQCVGPLHTPLADVAVLALSHFDTVGTATSVGEAAVKGLLSPAAMGRLAVAEAITNLASARVTALSDAKCSANWMWAAKLPGEGAALYDAAVAMADFMIATGVAVDGGKDSLSMAAKAPNGELVKAPGTLVISLYAPCPDITVTLTPDIKFPGASTLVLIDMSPAPGAASGAVPRHRIGGSALAQAYGVVGAPEQVPDVDDPARLVRAFNVIQDLMANSPGALASLHDISDGGMVTTALEMVFAGCCGVELALPAPLGGASPWDALFAEEVGWVAEVPNAHLAAVLQAFSGADVPAYTVGTTCAADLATVSVGGTELLRCAATELRDVWEATSFALERLQANPACVAQEQAGMASRRPPTYRLTYEPAPTAAAVLAATAKPRVAVLREEGSNGDREMAACFLLAGFDVWDITMSDLVAGRARLDDSFRGVVFPGALRAAAHAVGRREDRRCVMAGHSAATPCPTPPPSPAGGFSYADVLDSGKGWAGTIRFNDAVLAQFSAFYARPDTFSLGVCNGCQLAALLGWVPFGPLGSHAGVTVTEETQPRFVHNASGRFESRFPTVRVNETPAIMLRGMAGSTLGVWLQHGEGRAHFPDAAVLDAVFGAGGGPLLVPLQYVDDDVAPTEAYPFNPNGSPRGIAALCTPDGRHLAIMPHPERTHQAWAWPWVPTDWRRDGKNALKASPWLRMFQNAREWCESTVRG